MQGSDVKARLVDDLLRIGPVGARADHGIAEGPIDVDHGREGPVIAQRPAFFPHVAGKLLAQAKVIAGGNAHLVGNLRCERGAEHPALNVS